MFCYNLKLELLQSTLGWVVSFSCLQLIHDNTDTFLAFSMFEVVCIWPGVTHPPDLSGFVSQGPHCDLWPAEKPFSLQLHPKLSLPIFCKQDLLAFFLEVC